MTSSLSLRSAGLLSRRRVLGAAYRLFYDEPFAPVRGRDVWLFDKEGRDYLDAYNNVPVVGHCHPRVVEAMSRQASVLNTHTRYLHEGIIEYAERLLAKFPLALDTAMFTCTGSEANDLALRVTRAVTGATGLIITANAYHGVTSTLAEISPSLQPRVGEHVRTISSPAQLQDLAPEEAADRFVEEIERAVHSLRSAGYEPAALIVDTVFASDGIYPAPMGLLKTAARVIRSHGGLFIADEVQGGFGRSGLWWAFQRDDVVPDIVTLGKPMGNGYPMAGMILRADLAAAFAKKGRYFNTFGGNPVAAAVGMAVLDVIESQSLIENARSVGAYLSTAFHKLASHNPVISAVRGSGLYHALEIGTGDEQSTKTASSMVNDLRHQGVLVSVCGPAANVLKIRPPLTFTQRHADLLIANLDLALAMQSS